MTSVSKNMCIDKSDEFLNSTAHIIGIKNKLVGVKPSGRIH